MCLYGLETITFQGVYISSHVQPGMIAWSFSLWSLLRECSLGHAHGLWDFQGWLWYYLKTWLFRSHPWVRVAYCTVTAGSEAVFKPFVLVQLLPEVNSSAYNLRDTFKSTPHPTLIVSGRCSLAHACILPDYTIDCDPRSALLSCLSLLASTTLLLCHCSCTMELPASF